MITSVTIRLRDDDQDRSWTLRTAAAVVGFQYQVYLAGYPEPVATGWIAHDPEPKALDTLLRGIMSTFTVAIPSDPRVAGSFGNISPQADEITGRIKGVADPRALLPLTECRQAMDGPRPEDEPIALRPSSEPPPLAKEQEERFVELATDKTALKDQEPEVTPFIVHVNDNPPSPDSGLNLSALTPDNGISTPEQQERFADRAITLMKEGAPSPDDTPMIDNAPIAPRDIITADDGTRFEVVSVTEEHATQNVVVKASPVDLHRNLAFKVTVPMGVWNDVSTEADEDMLRQDVADTFAEQYCGRPLA